MFIEVIVDPDYAIYADVNLIIDTTNSDDTASSISDLFEAFDDVWNVHSEGKFIYFELIILSIIHHVKSYNSTVRRTKFHANNIDANSYTYYHWSRSDN